MVRPFRGQQKDIAHHRSELMIVMLAESLVVPLIDLLIDNILWVVCRGSDAIGIGGSSIKPMISVGSI